MQDSDVVQSLHSDLYPGVSAHWCASGRSNKNGVCTFVYVTWSWYEVRWGASRDNSLDAFLAWRPNIRMGNTPSSLGGGKEVKNEWSTRCDRCAMREKVFVFGTDVIQVFAPHHLLWFRAWVAQNESWLSTSWPLRITRLSRLVACKGSPFVTVGMARMTSAQQCLNA